MHTLGPMLSRPSPKLVDSIDAAGLVRILLAHGADLNARLKRPIIGRHQVPQNPVGIHSQRAIGPDDASSRQKEHLLRLHCRHNLGRVRGGDELTAWKHFGESLDNGPLPLRVQVEVEFVNQHDGLA